MEVERSGDHDDVAVVRHGLGDQVEVERRVVDAAGKAKTSDRKYFPQGFKHSWILQRHAR